MEILTPIVIAIVLEIKTDGEDQSGVDDWITPQSSIFLRCFPSSSVKPRVGDAFAGR